MSGFISDKAMISSLLEDLSYADAAATGTVLQRYCHDDVLWQLFHPFNTLRGVDMVADHFWNPLRVAFPDYDHRVNLLLAGEFESSRWVSTLGHVSGNFQAPWLGIPPTHGLTHLRFGMNARITAGLISHAHVYLDLVDVMRQAGRYPFRQMPGSPEQWPAPPLSSPPPAGAELEERGRRTLGIVRRMQAGMGFDGGQYGVEQELHAPCGTRR